MCEICSRLTTKPPERRQSSRSGVIIIYFELTLNRFHILFQCFIIVFEWKKKWNYHEPLGKLAANYPEI